jgi:hypothetical protein
MDEEPQQPARRPRTAVRASWTCPDQPLRVVPQPAILPRVLLLCPFLIAGAALAAEGDPPAAAGPAPSTDSAAADPVAAPDGAALQAEQDVVVLTNKNRILGRIEPTPDQPDNVLVNTGNGTIRLRRTSVAEIQWSLGSRLRDVAAAPENLSLRLTVVEWCRGQTRAFDDPYHAAALRLMDEISERPDLTTAMRGLHARLVDESRGRGPTQAVEMYRRYRAAGGDDAGHLARLAQIEGILTGHEAEHPPLVVDGTAQPSAAPTRAAEGLETRNFTPGMPQWSNPTTLSMVVSGTGPDRRRMLQMEFERGGKDKAVAERRVNWTVTDDAVLGFFLANQSGKPLGVAIAVKTGQQWDYFESPPEMVPPGPELHELRFDLKADRYKSAASNWTANSAITGLDAIKAVQILVYNGDVSGSVVITSMGFRRPGPL